MYIFAKRFIEYGVNKKSYFMNTNKSNNMLGCFNYYLPLLPFSTLLLVLICTISALGQNNLPLKVSIFDNLGFYLPDKIINPNTSNQKTVPQISFQEQNNNIRRSNEEVDRAIDEWYEKHSKPLEDEYWKAPGFSEQTKSYSDAFNNLKDMLTGKKPLSVKNAYYEVENAYGDIFLTKTEYSEQITKSSNFIKRWLNENHYDLKNNIALNYGIQKFMTDTLTINNKKNKEMPNAKPITHLGFYYDFEDFKADKDFRNYHATKAFATGNGQCHTLPIVYLILAESLGAKCYLSFAPIHSFIKYPDSKGNIHNFEVTNNWQITDQWYKEFFNIKSLAVKKGIYLNSYDKQQIVACAMLDLAGSYNRKFGVADGKFINQCVDFAMNYFQNKEANINGWTLRQKVVLAKINRIMKHNEKTKTKENIEKMPQTKILVNQLNSIENKMESLGYEPMPDSLYNKVLQTHKDRGNIQQSNQLNNLKKRNLFINQNKQK